MNFTQIPPPYAPLGRELQYTLTGLGNVGTSVYLLDPDSRHTLGLKRFTGSDTATFNAAPYIRRSLIFVPTGGNTGFHPALGRTASITVEAVSDSGPRIAAGVRTFLATVVPVTAPALLTTMPPERMIAPGECDELTFLTTGVCAVTVTAQAGDSTLAESYREEGAGVHIFRLDLGDFPDAEVLTVDAGACGTVVYTIDRTPQRGRRLAWRTDAGSIEHYTFPLEKSQTTVISKNRAYGPGGRFAANIETEVRTVLQSAFEFRDTLEALAGILSAPQVWLTENDDYTPVEVMNETAVTHRHDAVGTLEVEIRSIDKTRSPWS